MTGVEILSSETIYETEVFWWLIPLFAGIGLLVGLIIAIKNWIDFGFDGEDPHLIVTLVIVWAIVGFFATIITGHETDTVDYIEYKITIDDSVSMNEFLDTYEILNQEDKIYTVKERE